MKILVLVALVVSLVWSTNAWAQAIDLTGSIDQNEIELGDTVTYTLQASSTTGDSPSDPRLTPPNGFTIVNSGASPTHMVSIINGARSEKHGLTAQWQLRSDRLGTFSIGPGTISFGGSRRSGPVQRVTVVAPGQAKRKPQRGRQPFDPFAGGSGFDPFKGLFPGDDDPTGGDPFSGISTDPKFALDAARAPNAFLHATVDKNRAVVGEQVTLNVYLYEELNGRQSRPSDVHEATATDFVKRSLLQDETRATHVGNAMVGGRPWSVKLVRKNALFPIKAGRLSIAPMSLTLAGQRNGLRESETLTVDVAEPPVANRPSGYQIGDTGDFSLSATTTPRSITQHGAVGVTIELRGNGNMPATLPTPEIGGVEWLEPQTKDALGAVTNDKFGGTRTFTYVVRIHKEGAVDLGEIRLPFFDPQGRRYEIARAALGIVQVTKASGRDAGADVAEEVLPGLPKARAALEGKHNDTFLTERPLFWAGLLGMPLSCVLGIVLTGVVRRARDKRANAAPSPERIARTRRAEAESAMKSDDGKAALAAAVRAVEATLHASTGVNVRGTSGDGVLRELEAAGVSSATARSITRLLSECEDARFSPSGVTVESARAHWKRAKELLAAVESHSDVDEAPRSDDA
jgi:hypothetical protein